MTHWLLEEKPREKLLSHGASALSDSELLAIFYRVGIKGKSVIELARTHLISAGSLPQLLDVPYKQLQKLPGMGLANYASLQAALEISKRYVAAKLPDKMTLSSLTRVIDYLQLQFRHYTHEVLAGLFLDAKNQLLLFAELSHGGLSSAQLYPRRLVSQALECNAAALIVVHNHPSGDPTPSQADLEITVILKELLDKIEIRLLDHIILGKGCYFSFAESETGLEW